MHSFLKMKIIIIKIMKKIEKKIKKLHKITNIYSKTGLNVNKKKKKKKKKKSN